MTEDEAKTKWCPQARVATERHADGGSNRVQYADRSWDTTLGSRCIASACMAWRTTSSQHGYCGLAGRPRV